VTDASLVRVLAGLVLLVACAPSATTSVRCEAVHADGRSFDCAGYLEHESIFPMRWVLEVDASLEDRPVALRTMSASIGEGAACTFEREPRCALGRCDVLLRQGAHGVCALELDVDSEDGPLRDCWASHRSADERSYREDARVVSRACSDGP
jgi:hypothetical protein